MLDSGPCICKARRDVARDIFIRALHEAKRSSGRPKKCSPTFLSQPRGINSEPTPGDTHPIASIRHNVICPLLAQRTSQRSCKEIAYPAQKSSP